MQAYFGRASRHIFVLGRHLGLSNRGGLGQGDIRRGVRWKKWARGKGEGKNPPPAPTMPQEQPCTGKHPVTIQDDGIEPIFLAFRSEITPTLQANVFLTKCCFFNVAFQRRGVCKRFDGRHS